MGVLDFDKVFKNPQYTDTYKAPTNTNSLPDGAFEISTQNPDGSKKYSFDTIYQDRELINVAKDYYENLYKTKYDKDKDVVDEFIADRTWKQANIAMPGKGIISEYFDVQGLDDRQRGNLAYLQNYWNNLPNFYEEGGRGWVEGIWSNLWRGVLDPSNIVSFGVGSVATKYAAKKIGSTALQKQIANTSNKQVKKKLQKELKILQKQIKEGTYKPPVAKLTATATIPTVAFDSSLFAAADLISQKSEKEIGLRDKFDLKRTGQVALIGGGISVLPNGLFSYAAVKREVAPFSAMVNKNIDKEVSSTILALSGDAPGKNKKVIKTTTPADKNTSLLMGQSKGKKGSIANAYNKFFQKVFDSNNFYKLFTDAVTGVKSTSASIKRIFEETGEDITFTNPYLLMRRLSSSLVRAKDFMENGVMLFQPVKNKFGKNNFELVETANAKRDGGLEKIIEPFERVGEADQFLAYALAKKEKVTHQLNKTLPKKKRILTVLTEKEADRLIDYGELSLKQYKKRYKVESGRAPGINFKAGLKKLKGFTDDLLEMQRQAGIYDDAAVKRIKKAYPNGWVPAWGLKQGEETTFVAEKIIAGVTSPGKKRSITGVKDKVKINPLYLSLTDYTILAVRSADKNRAKVAFYNMYNQAIKNKTINEGEIVENVTAQTPTYQKIVTGKAVEDLEKLGIKFEKDAKGNVKGLDNLAEEDKTFTTIGFRDTFKDGDDIIDSVYVNGEKQYYKVKSELFKDVFEQARAPSVINKVLGFARFLTRLPAKAITYSPPFVAFNFIRDSLSATINSAFGFVPLLSSVQGFGLTYKGNKTGLNMKKYVNAVRRNDEFRKAMVHGLGFTSRAETEWRPNLFVDEIDKFGLSSSTSWYKRQMNYLGSTFLGRGVKGYADFVGRIEYASRLAEYQYAKNFGLSSTAAAFMGREVSTDFAMRGSSRLLQNYSAVTMFFNAGLQGFYRGARVLKEHPKKALPMIGLTIVAPELYFWNLNHNHREYRDVPDEVKMLNYLFPIYVREQADGSHLHEDGTRKVEEFAAIPKPYDFGVFANIATAILEGVWTKSPGVATQYIGTAFSVVMPGLALPTLANPWVSMYTNLNWQGDPIKPTGFNKLDKSLQYKSNTRESIILFSKYLQKITGPEGLALRGDGKIGTTISPVTLDYMVNSYFTGLASYPLDILDSIVYHKTLKDEFGDLPKERGDRQDTVRQPWSIVTRRFRVQVPVKNSKNIKKFYEIKSRADKISNTKAITTNDLREILNIDSFLNTKEVQELLGISPFLNMVADKLAESRETRSKITKAKYVNTTTKEPYTAELKRKHIDELIAIENEMARQAIIQIRKANFDTIESDIFGKTYDPEKYSTKEKKGVDFEMRKLFD
jgi:hypothetical protein